MHRLNSFKERILLSPWSIWIAGISLFFVVATIINPYLPDRIRFTLPHHFDLSLEMNLATWWSAALLVLVALLAYELRFTESIREIRPAWLVLAVLLAGLSLDEVGSIHEGFSWGVLSVIIALGGLSLAYALALLYRKEETRRAAVKIAAGFALLGSVALQEIVEHSVQWPDWAIGLRRGVEEGTELLGFILILSALLSRRRTESRAGSLLSAIPDPARMKHLLAVALGGLAVHIIFSLLEPALQDFYVGGDPVMWYPMSFSLLLFAAALWRSTRPAAGKPGAWLVLALYFLLISLASFYLIAPRQSISKLYTLGLLSNFYFLAACHWIVIAFFYQVLYGHWLMKNLLLFLLLAGLLILGLYSGNPVAQFLLAGAVTFFTVYLFGNPDFRSLKRQPEYESLSAPGSVSE